VIAFFRAGATPVKQRKIAISLAVVGAIAAPFVTGAWKMARMAWVPVPFSAQEKERRASYLKETNNCQTLTDRIEQLKKTDPSDFNVADKAIREMEKQAAINQADDAEYDCQRAQREFQRGWVYEWLPNTDKYLLFNSMAASAGFVSVFAVTYLLPALARRYWRWLNT
jgi:hypothetical protein